MQVYESVIQRISDRANNFNDFNNNFNDLNNNLNCSSDYFEQDWKKFQQKRYHIVKQWKQKVK
jgi:hypothetical protein